MFCGQRKEESSRIQLGCSAGTATCFQSSSCPAPAVTPVRGRASAGSHAPGCAPPQGRQREAGGVWGACLTAEVGDNGQ